MSATSTTMKTRRAAGSSRLVVALVIAVGLTGAGCGEQATAPTPETLAGVWIEQCQTRSREVTSCSARSDTPFRLEVRRDGGYSRTLDGFDACSSSSWTLDGATIEFVCSGGGLSLRERWRARIVGGRLVLWDDELGGRVLVREGVAPSGPQPGARAGGRVTRALGEIAYTVELPAGYYLAEETKVADRFVSDAPGSLEYRFKVSPAARAVGARPRCEGSYSVLSRGSDDAMRLICTEIPAGAFTTSCWARRGDKGAFTDEDFASAQRVCNSLTAAARG